jgi:hypothetical protein
MEIRKGLNMKIISLQCEHCGFKTEFPEDWIKLEKFYCIKCGGEMKYKDEDLGDNFPYLSPEEVQKQKIIFTSNKYVGKAITESDLEHFAMDLILIKGVDDLLKKWRR